MSKEFRSRIFGLDYSNAYCASFVRLFDFYSITSWLTFPFSVASVASIKNELLLNMLDFLENLHRKKKKIFIVDA